ncbi:hypothetical protein AB0J83_03420 [Actinoplanes sp. NPDC049596]|uniref:hypothetical protein n=1 Tax=unclassified Actinoplanes TaxID=2626549 RepID=UPI0034224751
MTETALAHRAVTAMIEIISDARIIHSRLVETISRDSDLGTTTKALDMAQATHMARTEGPILETAAYRDTLGVLLASMIANVRPTAKTVAANLIL